MSQKLPDVQARFRKGRGTRDRIANICWIIEKARELKKKIYFCFIDYAKAFDCVDHNKLENSSRNGNTRPPYLSPERLVCRTRINSWNWTWNKRLVPNWERSTSRLYIVTLLILPKCRVHPTKCLTAWTPRWNQDCGVIYQQSQIYRWYHSNGRKWRETKEPLEGERGEWKCWLKIQHSKN